MRNLVSENHAMIAPNDQPQFQRPSAKPVEPMSACVNMTYDVGPVAAGEQPSVKPVDPTTMCVNMIYDPGPITQAERTAARSFIDSVGGLERAKEVLRHMQPFDGDSTKE